MKRIWLIGLAVVAAAALGIGGWRWGRAGAVRDRLVAALPARPDFGAANAATRERIQEADTKARARWGGVEAVGRLSRLYHANGFYPEAMACYAILERWQPKEPRWFHRHAAILAGYGDSEPAAQLWQRVLALAPDYAAARLRIGDNELKAGHRSAAETAYREVLRRNADNAWARLGLARIDFEAHEWDAAREKLEAVAQQTDGQLGADLLVTVDQKLSRYDLARAVRGTAKTGGVYRDPPDPWIDELIEDCYDPFRIALAAGVCVHAGNPARGEQLLRRALEIAPNDVSTRFQLGTFYATQQNPAGALEQLQRCTELAPTFADGWAWLSAQQAKAGDRAVADRTLAEGLVHCPESPGLHLMYARKLEQAGRSSEAIGEFLNSIHLRPNEPDAYVALGSLLVKLGRIDEGVQQMRAALATDPGEPLALSILTLTTIASGDKAEARRWMQRVAEQPRIEPNQYERIVRNYHEQFGEEWRPDPAQP